MNEYLEKVENFHNNFNHIVSENWKEQSIEIRKLRFSLLFEELSELAQSLDVMGHFEDLCERNKKGTHTFLFSGEEPSDGNNFKEDGILDALCDLQYVLSGAVLALGYKNIFDNSFNEVHRSNMSKMCDSVEQAEETIEWYREEGEKLNIDIVPKNDKYILVREDGKIMKNKYYSSAKLSKIIEENNEN